MLTEEKFLSSQRPGEYLKYLRFTPPDSGEQLPVILYLHGAGSRGDELSQMSTDVGPLGEIGRGRELKAVIVAPQCHCDTWFELFDVLLEFIDAVRCQPAINQNRVYLCGVSMGAYTAWQVAMSRPDWFAALVPVCGGGMYWNAARLKNLPIWAFHGALDTVVLPEESIHMIAAVNHAGGNAKITVYPDVAHDSWIKAFADDKLWEWMSAQKKVETEE